MPDCFYSTQELPSAADMSTVLENITEAIRDVKRFVCKTSEMLVELVHRLPEWGKTPKSKLMLFANGFEEEINALSLVGNQ